MTRRTTTATTLATLLVVQALVASARVAPAKLENGAPSIDRLIEQFIGAISANDRDALHRLRVTEAEYLGTILPGTRDGAQRRKWPQEVKAFYWSQMNDKSSFYEGFLLKKFGGRTYQVKSVKYEKGTQKYATYSAYKQLRLALEDGEGNPLELATGSVAEVNGHYKFISFIRD